MKTLTNFTANNQVSLLAIVKKIRREVTEYLATILVYITTGSSQTFGGGTLELYLSPDGGTTLIPLTAQAGGSPLTFTANGMAVFTTGHPSNNTDTLQLYGKVTGATSPNFNVCVLDNNG
jgi:hypothetical protein